MNFWPAFSSFMVIFLAELGDKTQLLALGFASRYPFWEVIAAISCATGVLMALAVLGGGILDHFIPMFYVKFLAGLMFLFFGFWTLMAKEKEEEKAQAKGGRNPFWIVFASFFIAELGDKTQLATLGLSARYGAPLLVWVGAFLGMVLVNFISVFLGCRLNKFISRDWLKFIGAAVFIIFGIITLVELFF